MKTWFQTLKYENLQNYTIFKDNHKTVIIIINMNDLKKIEKSQIYRLIIPINLIRTRYILKYSVFNLRRKPIFHFSVVNLWTVSVTI